MESDEQETLKGQGNVVFISNPNVDADDACDFNADTKFSGFNLKLVLPRCSSFSQQEEFEESSLNNKDMEPLLCIFKSNSELFSGAEKKIRFGGG